MLESGYFIYWECKKLIVMVMMYVRKILNCMGAFKNFRGGIRITLPIFYDNTLDELKIGPLVFKMFIFDPLIFR